MLRAEFERDLMTTAGRTLTILWAGMVGTPLVLNLVAALVPLEGVLSGSPPPPALVNILYGLAMAAGLGSIVWRRLWTGPERPTVGPTAAGMRAPAGERSVGEDPDEQRAIALLARYVTRLMIAWALVDTVAILGFVATVLTADPAHVRWLGGFSLALLLAHRPSTGPLEEGLDRLKRGA
jgi:hypothetical protein